MKKKNGFTLVELLAVIVVLALIMIIAIPSVLKVMNSARRQSFALYVDKIVTAVQTQYLFDAAAGSIPGAGYYAYSIQDDLDLAGTGSYEGYVIVDAFNEKIDRPEYSIYMKDANYMILGHNVTNRKMPKAEDQDAIRDFESGAWNPVSSIYLACKQIAGEENCKNRNGAVLSE